MKKALIETAGFQEGDIDLLTSTQQGKRSPTRINIIKRVTYVKDHAGPDDTFVFFFSGHGMEKEGESYLLTRDADPETKESLRESALKMSTLRKILEEMPTKKILLFVDACRNDPVAGKGDADNPLTENQSKNLVIQGKKGPAETGGSYFSLTFFSCGIGQRSYEWSEEKMGFFTYYLVKGLRGDDRAMDSGGNVTLGSLKKYLGERVAQAIEKEKGGAIKQEPWVKGDASANADNWVFAKTSSRMKTPSPVKMESEQSLKNFVPVNPNVLISAFDNGNIYRVYNGGKPPSFTITRPFLLTYIMDYHWNEGKGKVPGTITLMHQDGTTYGPWKASGSAPGAGGSGWFLYWEFRPNVVLKAGTYTVIDSDPATWAWNEATNGCGMTRIQGNY